MKQPQVLPQTRDLNTKVFAFESKFHRGLACILAVISSNSYSNPLAGVIVSEVFAL